ncbi:MAG: DUF5673 domain-containing protein [Tissierellia bacterium]|nr:DUF5673 domain-containing protein [Tissierellia bacterium]
MKQSDIILALYTMLFAFVCYTGYKIFQVRKNISHQQHLFSQRPRILHYILIGLLISMIFLVDGLYLRLILTGISIYFIYNATERISISESGIYHNGKLDSWKEVKQWSFDEKKENLIIQTSHPKPNNIRVYPTRKEDRQNINMLIRNYKQKKKRK